MTAKERLVMHEGLVDLIINHQYVPEKSQANFNELLGALRELNPGAKYDPGCSGCLMTIAQRAKVTILSIKHEGLTFMTFPKRTMSEAHKEAIRQAKNKK